MNLDRLSREERNRLGIVLGTPSRIRKAVRRWVKQDRPNVFEGETISEVVQVTRETLSAQHTQALTAEVAKREAAEQTLLAEFETEYAQLNTEAERNAILYNKRIQLKTEKNTKLREELYEEKATVKIYQADFGGIRPKPLNRFQRFVGACFGFWRATDAISIAVSTYR